MTKSNNQNNDTNEALIIGCHNDNQKDNDHGFKETIVFPLEIVRGLAFPYLLNEHHQ